MAVSKAQQKAVNKYMRENYDRIAITTPKGQKEIIQAHAAAHSESVNGFINRAISETMERDSTSGPQEAAETPTGATPAGSGPLSPDMLKTAQEAAGAAQGAGAVSLPPDTLEKAREAAQAAGEALPQFIARAVDIQVQRDALARKLGGAHGD